MKQIKSESGWIKTILHASSIVSAAGLLVWKLSNYETRIGLWEKSLDKQTSAVERNAQRIGTLEMKVAVIESQVTNSNENTRAHYHAYDSARPVYWLWPVADRVGPLCPTDGVHVSFTNRDVQSLR